MVVLHFCDQKGHFFLDICYFNYYRTSFKKYVALSHKEINILFTVAQSDL